MKTDFDLHSKDPTLTPLMSNNQVIYEESGQPYFIAYEYPGRTSIDNNIEYTDINVEFTGLNAAESLVNSYGDWHVENVLIDSQINVKKYLQHQVGVPYIC